MVRTLNCCSRCVAEEPGAGLDYASCASGASCIVSAIRASIPNEPLIDQLQRSQRIVPSRCSCDELVCVIRMEVGLS